MALRAVDIGLPEVPGRLWLSSMPGRFEPWPRFVAEAQAAGIVVLVCLTPRHEVARLSPDYHAALDDGTLPFRLLHAPMHDFGLDEQRERFDRAVAAAAQALRDGDAVLLHCAAGIGRTGTAAACVLKTLGLRTAVALQRVRDAGSDPESALQSGLVDEF